MQVSRNVLANTLWNPLNELTTLMDLKNNNGIFFGFNEIQQFVRLVEFCYITTFRTLWDVVKCLNKTSMVLAKQRLIRKVMLLCIWHRKAVTPVLHSTLNIQLLNSLQVQKSNITDDNDLWQPMTSDSIIGLLCKTVRNCLEDVYININDSPDLIKTNTLGLCHYLKADVHTISWNPILDLWTLKKQTNLGIFLGLEQCWRDRLSLKDSFYMTFQQTI